MIIRVWQLLRRYIAIHELICIFTVSVSVFLAIFALLYISISPNNNVKHRLDFWSMHCVLISDRLSKEIDDLHMIKEKLLYDVSLIEAKRRSDVVTYKMLQEEILLLQKEKKNLSEQVNQLTTSFIRLQNESFYVNRELKETMHRIESVHLSPLLLSENNNHKLKSSNQPPEFNKPHVFNNNFLSTSKCCQSCLFTFFLIEPDLKFLDSSQSGKIIYESLKAAKYRVSDPTYACLLVSVGSSDPRLENNNHATDLESSELFNRVHFYQSTKAIDISVQSSNIAFVAPNIENFRPNLDIIFPPITFNFNKSSFGDTKKLAPLVPIHRKHLISFASTLPINGSEMYTALFKYLTPGGKNYNVLFRFNRLPGPYEDRFYPGKTYVDIAGNLSSRLELLGNSTFTIVTGTTVNSFQIRLIEALSQSAIPIVFTSQYDYLPFNEFIDWRLTCLVVPNNQMPNLLNIVKSMTDNDLMALKYRARDLFVQYFANVETLVHVTLEAWRYRLGLRSHPVVDYKSDLKLVKSYDSLSSNVDYLLNHHDSLEFQSNYSHLVNRNQNWNNFPGPFWAYPHHPHKSLLPSEAKFVGSEKGFRPINFGKNGDGRYFKLALGGDIEAETFTILLLTHQREQILMQMIREFDKLPYLHSVIVVWNSPYEVSHNLVWPLISAPIHVVRGPKNSLNNRFLPYEEIKTEAVLSLDDDVFLTHDEILLTFRVWRENRDRLVGLPGRLHTWDPGNQTWVYNSQPSCEVSLVLTGAAFVHKYYFYVYTYSMSSLIRAKVDDYMNCEDIAMNFLVAHMTRKPPIKTTIKRTFLCEQCGSSSLWLNSSHFTERHECINYFSTIYGYNPLLSTQFRADSILYKFYSPYVNSCFDSV